MTTSAAGQDFPAEVEARWRKAHRDFALSMSHALPIQESPGGAVYTSIDERLVQAIWHDQMIRGGELATASGKHVEVIEPGRWNTGRGPDFQDARVRLLGEVVSGDIEIHVGSGDWTRHGHHQNFEYNRVVLHVVLRAEDDRPYEDKQNGERLERLVLESFLEPDLDTIRSTINLADYPYGRPTYVGLCHEAFVKMPPAQLAEFLQLSGQSRMEAKIQRFQAQSHTAGFHQLIYQSLLTAQGFKSSKTLYFLLAKRAPIAELVELSRDFPSEDRADFFLSVLMNVAQLMPRQTELIDSLDEEGVQCRDRLDRFWKSARPYFSDRLIPPSKRWYAGMRPAGFPPRRLAAAAVLLGRLTDRSHPLFDRLLQQIRNSDLKSYTPKQLREFWKDLVKDIPVSGEDHYFGTHFTLGGKKQKPQALLGEPAARSLLFNVFLPLVVLKARQDKDKKLEARAWQTIDQFPILEKNSVTRFMEKRLFGETGLSRGLLKKEIIQQAMLKLFSDCCAGNERTCDDCTFLKVADRIARGEEAV